MKTKCGLSVLLAFLCFLFSFSFPTISWSQAPIATTQAATSVSTTSATLNGIVNANGLSTTVAFEYGLDTSYGSGVTATPSTVSGSTSTAVSGVIMGLTPNTTYHFRVYGYSAAGSTYGADMTFTTPTAPPTVTTLAATSVSTTSATLNGIVNANGLSTTVAFEYGLDTSYGSGVTATPSTVSGSTSTAVSGVIAGLTPNTTYHFRVYGYSAAGSTYGADMTFNTGEIVMIPTLTEWGMIIFASLMAVTALVFIRRRNRAR